MTKMVKFQAVRQESLLGTTRRRIPFAAELRQQLLRRQQAGAAVAELDRQGIGEQEAEQRGVADGAHLNGVRRLLLKVFDRPQGDAVGSADQRAGVRVDHFGGVLETALVAQLAQRGARRELEAFTGVEVGLIAALAGGGVAELHPR